MIRKRILQLAVAFSTTALDKKVDFMLKVLQHILMSRPVEHPEHAAYSDAVKELQADGMYELHRLATKMPDQLLVSSFVLPKEEMLTFFLGCLPPAGSKSQRDYCLGHN
jgi:hypothetical protein